MLAAACSSQPRLPAPQQAHASAAGTTLAALERGRCIAALRCGSCHTACPPATVAAAAWPGEVDRMAKRSGLRADEREDLLAYLAAVR